MTASTSVDGDFLTLADPYRKELLAHCYRMSGSFQDAEDLVQETMLRAWRAQHTFEGRSSLRTWLYRIATNTCLTALQNRSRRPLPTGLGSPDANPAEELVQDHEVPWLGPMPDRVFDAQDDPASVVASRESVRLAFIAALQHLPPRQRAVLLLRDVLQWRAAEVADALGTSTAAVNSLLQRARAQLEQSGVAEDDLVEPDSPAERELLARYVDAFESYDIAAIVELFTREAIWEMPPYTGWYRGAETIGRLISLNCPANAPDDMRLVPARANRQPAFGMYMRGEDGRHHPFQLHVLEIRPHGLTHVVSFFDVGLFDRFGLPQLPPE